MQAIQRSHCFIEGRMWGLEDITVIDRAILLRRGHSHEFALREVSFQAAQLTGSAESEP